MYHIEYKDFIECSKPYLNNKKYKKGHTSILTKSKILISAPHGVEQTRLGKRKCSEKGSARFAIQLQKLLNSNIIIKTLNLYDDANFDLNCGYRKQMNKIIKKKHILILFDIHGLAKHRECDVNLGINFGQNIKSNIFLYENIYNNLVANGFSVFVDTPFSGKYPTISADFSQRFNIFTLQIEINSAITGHKQNIDKLNLLLNIMSNSILTSLQKNK